MMILHSRLSPSGYHILPRSVATGPGCVNCVETHGRGSGDPFAAQLIRSVFSLLVFNRAYFGRTIYHMIHIKTHRYFERTVTSWRRCFCDIVPAAPQTTSNLPHVS